LYFAFLPYGGGKQKHKGIQQSILTSMLLKNPKQFKLYYEPFVGGFGSVYNSLPLLIKNGIKDIYLSDLNPSLINAYKQVQKNPKQVQRHLASFELNYYRAHNKFYPTTKEEGKELFEKLHKEFTHLETKKRMNPKRAALFLYLIHNTQGGMLSFNMDNQTNKFTFCYCQNKLKQIPLIINKVEIYNKIFNLGNIKFSIKKYETVLNKIKNDSTALVLFDPPYVNYEEISTSKDFTNCSYNYGINDFNHRELLNKIKDSKYSFIYYNNHNPHLENFAKDENYNYVKKDVIYKNGTVGKKCVEILMFKDRVGKEIRTVNFTNFRQIEIKQAS
jgi:site-specific DNA-adenine methylase